MGYNREIRYHDPTRPFFNILVQDSRTADTRIHIHHEQRPVLPNPLHKTGEELVVGLEQAYYEEEADEGGVEEEGTFVNSVYHYTAIQRLYQKRQYPQAKK